MNFAENREFIKSILFEIIEDNNLRQFQRNILQQFDSIMIDMKHNQFDFSDFNEMNKEVLYNMNIYISNLNARNEKNQDQKMESLYSYDNRSHKNQIGNITDDGNELQFNVTQQPYSSLQPSDVTNKAIAQKRRDEFNNQFQKRREEFSEFAPKKPDAIDFTDKGEF